MVCFHLFLKESDLLSQTVSLHKRKGGAKSVTFAIVRMMFIASVASLHSDHFGSEATNVKQFTFA